MPSSALTLAVLTTLLMVTSPKNRIASAQDPVRKPASVQVGDIDRWQELMRHSVDFFERCAFDKESGSYYSEIDIDGAVQSKVRHIIATSRMLYALAHASRIDPKYTTRAAGLREYLRRKMTANEDIVGPYFRVAINDGEKDVVKVWNPERMKNEWVERVPTELIVNEQAYGLCGLVASYSVEPTTTALEEIEAHYRAFRQRFKDTSGTGFFDRYTLYATDKPGAANNTKSHDSTVYVATAFLLELHDAVHRIAASEGIDAKHRELARNLEAIAATDIAELADATANKMTDADDTGFIVEKFDGDWKPMRGDPEQGGETFGVTGHNFQAAWFLLRASQMPSASKEKSKSYSDKAGKILHNMLAKTEKGEGELRASPIDFVNGGFHDIFRREAGAPIFHTNKAWWQQAEGILALTLAEKLGVVADRKALDARDKALQFYVNHFIDYTKGGEFAVVKRQGKPVETELKGQVGKSAYHTVELYRYLTEYASTR
jgi:mannobiose 2-epimerase